MKRHFGKYLPIVAVTAILAVMASVPAFAAGWQAKYERFSGTAGATLGVGDVVCISGADGKVYKADADDAAKRPAVGVIGKGGAAGAKVEIITRGIISGMTAATSGNRIFLSATAGKTVDTAPTNAQLLGFVLPPETAAATNTVYYINVQLPASTGAGY